MDRAADSRANLRETRGGAGASSRSEVRMQLFERCAALLLAELDAREAGDRLGAEALKAQRDALRDAWEQMGTTPPGGTPAQEDFGEALREATVEIEHREAVDFALRERILALGAAVARQMPSRARVQPNAGRRALPAASADVKHALDITF